MNSHTFFPPPSGKVCIKFTAAAPKSKPLRSASTRGRQVARFRQGVTRWRQRRQKQQRAASRSPKPRPGKRSRAPGAGAARGRPNPRPLSNPTFPPDARWWWRRGQRALLTQCAGLRPGSSCGKPLRALPFRRRYILLLAGHPKDMPARKPSWPARRTAR